MKQGRGGEGKAQETNSATWAEVLRDTWSVKLTRMMAFLTEAGVWVLY